MRLHGKWALKFFGQFAVSAASFGPRTPDGWDRMVVGGVYELVIHPGLPHAHSRRADRELHVLGTVLDPQHTLRGDAAVLSNLLDSFQQFEDLESGLAQLGGRWAIIASAGSVVRVYHDAAGLQAVYRATDPDGVVTAASQPALLENLGRTSSDPALRIQYGRSLTQPGYWPP